MRVGTRIAIAAIGVGALGLVGTAFAANATTTPTPEPSNGSSVAPDRNDPDAAGNGPGRMGARANGPQGAPGQGQHRGAGMHGGLFGIGRGGGAPIHGSVVVPKSGGGYQTVDGQRGTVTAVSADSITVHSEDGFDKTYVVNAETKVNGKSGGIASVKVDDKIAIVGIESGDTTTAVHILDRPEGGKGTKPLAPPNSSAPAPGPTT